MAQVTAQLPLSRAIGWIARPPPAVRFALKLGTSVAAGIWLAYVSGLDWGLTIWIAIMFVSQPNVGASIKKGLSRTCGSVGAALVSIAIYGLFAQQPPLMLAGLCAVLALAVYGMTGPRFQYAWLVFGFDTIVILVKAIPGSDQIETLSFERASLTALGVLIVFVADAVFWPVRAEEQLREGLAERCRRLGDTLKQHRESLGSDHAPEQAGPPPSSPLIQQMGLVEQFRDEIGATPARVQAFSRIALLLEALASRVRLLERGYRAESTPPAPPVRATLAQLGAVLDTALAKASRALSADRAPEPFAEALEHSLASFQGERMAHAVMRDVAALLRRLEEALLGLANANANEDGGAKDGTASEAGPGAAWEWPRVDPIRLQLGFRAGIAGGGVLIAMLSMGWSPEKDVLAMILGPIVAFILAGMSSTRGASTKISIGLTAGILLGWLIADLASVFLFTQLDRMPLSLVYPFVVAGGAGYLIVRGSFLGPLGALFAMLTAILPVFIGDAPVPNVDVSYGLACGELLGVAAGVIAQRLLWPRTAMQTFLQRAAAQLELCLRALGGAEPGTEAATRGREAAGLVSGYAKQLTMLGQLHALAHVEPVESALDDRRRAELLVVIQDLFDAVLGARGAPSMLLLERGGVLEPLRDALRREDEALLASIRAAAETLRGEAPPEAAGSALDEAHRAVLARLDELRARPEHLPGITAEETETFLTHLDSRRLLVDRQIAIEAWLAEWSRSRISASAV